MRSRVSQLVTSASRASRTTTPSSSTPNPSSALRTSYTCATCRSALQPRTIQPHHRRPFTSGPIHHQNTSSSSSSSPSSSACSSSSSSPSSPPSETPPPQSQRTHYTLFPQTFPSGPPPASPFLPDLRAFRSEFLQLQTRTHPDRFPSAEKAAAEAASAALNDAYRTLADPLRHANYLLSLRGVETEDESAKLEAGGAGGDAELLMEVMEARERVEEVGSEEELGPLREENEARIAASVAGLEALVGGEKWEEAGREAVRLRYWRNVEESIRGWEKGVGGGAVHH